MKKACFIFMMIGFLFGSNVEIVPACDASEISLCQGMSVLVRGFMTEYEDVPLKLLNPEFESTGDVRRFYEDYFESELQHFKNGELIWINAFLDGQLVGFSTFELESASEAYMNLLVVDPDVQRMGIGEKLTMAILDYYPSIREIRLLLRNVNEGGRKFYEKLGFRDFEYERDDNFVDTSLLTGLKWSRR